MRSAHRRQVAGEGRFLHRSRRHIERVTVSAECAEQQAKVKREDRAGRQHAGVRDAAKLLINLIRVLAALRCLDNRWRRFASGALRVQVAEADACRELSILKALPLDE